MMTADQEFTLEVETLYYDVVELIVKHLNHENIIIDLSDKFANAKDLFSEAYSNLFKGADDLEFLCNEK